MPQKNLETSIVERAKDAIKQTPPKKLKTAVSTAEHLSAINLLKEGVRIERFFFVVDSVNRKVEHANGLARWLGYDDDTFTLEKYFEIIPPEYMEYLIHLAKITFEIANSKDFRVEFCQQQYVIDMALRHANGHFVLCKRSLRAWQWQFDKDKQIVTHYLNEFAITNPYIKELSPNLSPRILDAFGNKLFDLEEILKHNSTGVVETNKMVFSTQELRILRKVAYNPSITAQEIASSFKTKVSTIHTLNKRILEKGRESFHDKSFETVRELSQLLRKNFIL